MSASKAIRLLCLAAVALLYVSLSRRPSPTPARASAFSRAERLVLHSNSFASPARGGRTVIVTAATGNYLRLVHNLACSVRRAVARNVVVFSLDRNLSHALAPTKLAHISFSRFNDAPAAAAAPPFAFGSRRFNAVSKLKLGIVLHVLRAGYDVLFSDVDVVWCSDVFAPLSARAASRSTLFIQNDSPTQKRNSTLNSGFYYARAEPNTLRFFEALTENALQARNAAINDQVAFNRLACKEQGVRFARKTRRYGTLPCCRWAHALDIVSLPLQVFPNGASKFERRRMYELPRGKLRSLCDSRRIAMWHNNWGGADLKFSRFDEHRMWMASANTGTCV